MLAVIADDDKEYDEDEYALMRQKQALDLREDIKDAFEGFQTERHAFEKTLLFGSDRKSKLQDPSVPDTKKSILLGKGGLD